MSRATYRYFKKKFPLHYLPLFLPSPLKKNTAYLKKENEGAETERTSLPIGSVWHSME
jgi:hypothetical protein